jgi:hypothetical protein
LDRVEGAKWDGGLVVGRNWHLRDGLSTVRDATTGTTDGGWTLRQVTVGPSGSAITLSIVGLKSGKTFSEARTVWPTTCGDAESAFLSTFSDTGMSFQGHTKERWAFVPTFLNCGLTLVPYYATDEVYQAPEHRGGMINGGLPAVDG